MGLVRISQASIATRLHVEISTGQSACGSQRRIATGNVFRHGQTVPAHRRLDAYVENV